MDSHLDEENYTVFLATLDKEQLVRLALINRQQMMEHRMRYLRVRGAVLHGDADEAQNLFTAFEGEPMATEIPDEINYMRFVEQRLWK